MYKTLTKKELGKPSTSKNIAAKARVYLKKILNLVFSSYAYTSDKGVSLDSKRLKKGPDRDKLLYGIQLADHVWNLAERSDYYTHKVKSNQQVAEILEKNRCLYSASSKRVLWRCQDGLVDEIYMEDDKELIIPLLAPVPVVQVAAPPDYDSDVELIIPLSK